MGARVGWVFTVPFGLLIGAALGGGAFSTPGQSTAGRASAQLVLTLNATAARLGQYQRVELRIGGIPAVRNPYDPDEADVRLEARTPAGRVVIMPAFYKEPFRIVSVERSGKPVDCFIPAGQPAWFGRYTPTAPGIHEIIAVARLGGRTLKSRPVRLECIPSSRPGFLTVSRRDPRFLETSDGRPFFVIGQNVAFIKDTFETAEMLERLAAHGVNFLRVWTCCEDWGMALEARKSAWSRSWDWRPPYVKDASGRQWVWVTGEGVTAQPNWRQAFEPNKEYVLRARLRSDAPTTVRVSLMGLNVMTEWAASPEARHVEYRFRTGGGLTTLEGLRLESLGSTAYVRDLSLTPVDGGHNLLWDADPDRPVLGNYNQVDCAMLDKLVEDAERLGIRLQLCVLTRDLYMERLEDPNSDAYRRAMADARKLFRYCIARWGASTAVAVWEYWNEMDPGKPTERFYTEVGDYLRKIDPYGRPRTTSAWGDAVDDWQHPAIDVPNMHWYMRPVEDAFHRDAVAGVLRKAAELRHAAPDKPALMAEFGLADNNWRPSARAQQDASFLHLKHALWASALSGLSGTVMAWWWEDIHAREGYRVYRPVAKFASTIPWITEKLAPTSARASAEHIRVVGLQSDRSAHIWLYDTRFPWYAVTAEGSRPSPVTGLTLTIEGLRPGRYRVWWFDTDSAAETEGPTTVVSASSMTWTVPVFQGDLALRVIRER